MNIDDMEGLDDATRKEIEELMKVTREKDGDYTYALAQLDLGKLLYEKNMAREAILIWRNIARTDDKRIYIPAQWNISSALVDNGNIDEAFSIWCSFKQTDALEIYVQAQWNIGLFYASNGDNDKAILTWENIQKEDSPSIYALIQLNVGHIFFEKGDIEKALEVWSKIERVDNHEKYAKAQWVSGLALLSKGSEEAAVSAWRNIRDSDNSEVYAKAQFKIGLQLIKTRSCIDDAKIAFDKSRDIYSYESYCYIHICELLLNKHTHIFGRKLQIFLNKIILIINELTLYFDNSDNIQKTPERKLAHYTGIDTTNLLLNNSGHKLPSSFRLNTINNVNDPSEGKLLNNYLNEDKDTLLYTLDFDENFQAFVSCFTFNHDSLNQFRLYGKKDNQEASGTSLVLKQDFFQSRDIVSGMSFISSLNITRNFNNILDNTSRTNEQNKTNEIVKQQIDKKPVMRCIYIEPESDYVHLAQRNYLTFYREFKSEENPEEEWNSYKKDMDEKTLEVRALLKKLRIIYQSLKNKHLNDFNKYSKLINKTLLPLKYLIKHSAFQEEQECRMIYITSLDRPEVQMEFGRFLYVEYEADIKSHLDKIYIAPAATQYQPYLAKLLCDTNVKIELSNNPYRQTS